MQVSVRDNNVDQALRALKKKLQREGVFREMKLKQHFEKPSVKSAREKLKRSVVRANWRARRRSAKVWSDVTGPKDGGACPAG
jgi:small subunit ribosomal protein S21